MTFPDAQYTTTTPAFRLTATPATGVALPANDPSQYGNRPLAAYLQADTHDIRFTTDGVTVPTSSVGQLLTAGAEPFFYPGPLNQLQFIQVASGAKLNVVYSQDPVEQGPQGVVGPQGPAGPSGADGSADFNALLAYLGLSQPGVLVDGDGNVLVDGDNNVLMA